MDKRLQQELKAAFNQKDKGDNEKYGDTLQAIANYIASKGLSQQEDLLNEFLNFVNKANVWGISQYGLLKEGYVAKPEFVVQRDFCKQCGTAIPRKKNGRPSEYCSVRCRVAHFREIRKPKSYIAQIDTNEGVKQGPKKATDKAKRKKESNVTKKRKVTTEQQELSLE